MTRILAIADEVDEGLYGDKLIRLKPDLVVSCGDLPFDYLENLVSRLDVPVVYVPGNHDPDLYRHDTTWLPLSTDTPIPGPEGCDNADRRIIDAAGLRIAGLGGCVRYREGPNQYSQGEMWRSGVWLEARLRLRRVRDARSPDILVTHAPPAGSGAGDDTAHEGFAVFHRLIETLRPKLLVHGHVHPYGVTKPDRQLGPTLVVNAIPYRLLEI